MCNLIVGAVEMNISILPAGTPWPSGAYIDLAVINIAEANVARTLGANLVPGDEPGMGGWRAIAVRLESGSVIEIISYDASPEPGFTIRADGTNKLSMVLKECMALFGLQDVDLRWVAPGLDNKRERC